MSEGDGGGGIEAAGPCPEPGREERLARVVFECAGRARAGEPLDVARVLAQHPDLQPELALALEVLSGSAPEPGAQLPRESLGGQRILREIGRGGMGVVYEAVDLTLGRRVALKVLPLPPFFEGARRERFLREARAAARLHHTRIVPIFEVGEEGGVLFYTMQFIQGRGLDRVLRELARRRDGGDRGAGPPGEAGGDEVASAIARRLTGGDPHGALRQGHHHWVARVGAEIADALEHAHREGVLHRDVKPSNVILDAQASAWLADFGLAKLEVEASTLTQSTDIVGTVAYMAPERFAGEGDARSDVYALGATLYEMLLLRPAFQDPDRQRLLRKIAEEDPAPPRRIDPSVPRDLETIVLRAMARDPERRYGTAGELREELGRCLRGEPVLARRAGPTERAARWCRRNPVVSILGGSVLLLLVVLLGVFAFSARRLSERLYAAELARAQTLRLGGRPGRRFESLAAIARAAKIHPSPELRDEAIAALGLADVREVLRRDAPKGERIQGVFDHDLERYCAVDETSGQIVLRRLADGLEIARLGGPGERWSPQAFNPAGDFLAAAEVSRESKRRLEFRRLPSLEPWWTREAGAWRGGFAFSPRGAEAAWGTPDGDVEILDVAERAVVRTIARGLQSPVVLWFSGDGSKLLVLSGEWGAQRLEVCEVSGVRAPVPLEATGLVYSAALSPGGTVVAMNGSGAAVRLVDAASGETLRNLQGHLSTAVSIVFSPRGDFLATGSWDGTTRLWDPERGDLLLTQAIHEGSVAFRRDGLRLANVSADRLVVCEVNPGIERRTLRGSRVPPTPGGFHQAFHRSGRLLLTGWSLWDVHADRELPIDVVRWDMGQFAFPPGGDLLYTAGDGRLRRRPLEVVQGPSGPVARVGESQVITGAGAGLGAFAIDSSGVLLAGIEAQSRIVSIDLDAPGSKAVLGSHPGGAWITISPDGRFAASGTWNRGKGARLWDVRERRLVRDLAEGHSAYVSFDPRGRWLATATPGEYHLWETAGWERVRVMRREVTVGLPGFAAWSPDGAVLAITLTQSRVLLLDPETGAPLGRIESSHPRTVLHILFSPDGGKLSLGCADAAIEMWDLHRVRQGLIAVGLDPASLPAALVEPPAQPSPLRLEISGMEEEAVAAVQLEDVLREAPRDPLPVLAAAGKLQRGGDWRGSMRLLERLVELAPRSAEALNGLAWALVTGPEEARDARRAVELAERAIQAGGRRPAYINTLGVAQFRTGGCRAAIDTLLESAERAGGASAWDEFPIAMCLLELGFESLARDHFARGRRWMERNPEIPREEAQELRTLLAEAEEKLKARSPKTNTSPPGHPARDD